MSILNEATANLWVDRIHDWQSGDLSKAGWCRANGCSYYAFSYWYSKLVCLGRITPASTMNSAKPAAEEYTFVELACSSSDSERSSCGADHSAQDLILQYKDFTIRVPDGSTKQNLSMVMEVLKNT